MCVCVCVCVCACMCLGACSVYREVWNVWGYGMMSDMEAEVCDMLQKMDEQRVRPKTPLHLV